MRRALYLVFLSFSIAGCALSHNPYFWDFGRVKKGEVLKHEFILVNNTEKTLQVESISTSCGCTVSEVKEKSIPAGASTLIGVKFDTAGYSGVIEQYVYVYTDNPKNSILKFTVKAEIK